MSDQITELRAMLQRTGATQQQIDALLAKPKARKAKPVPSRPSDPGKARAILQAMVLPTAKTEACLESLLDAREVGDRNAEVNAWNALRAFPPEALDGWQEATGEPPPTTLDELKRQLALSGLTFDVARGDWTPSDVLPALRGALQKLRRESKPDKPDSKPDTGKKPMPDSVDVRDLCHLLQKGLPGGKSRSEIARDFTGGNTKKADSLLRQARRYRHLWE